VNNNEELCEAAFGNFVNWMIGEQLGGGGGTPKNKKKGLDYYD
jgi:hypothetical protein